MNDNFNFYKEEFKLKSIQEERSLYNDKLPNL